MLLVLVNHALGAWGAVFERDFSPFDGRLGRLGVLFFFVHTCYVLMASLDRAGLEGAALARAFYVRRAFRIYPLAMLCVAMVVLLRIPSTPWGSFEPPGAGAIASNLALTFNLSGTPPVLGPLWTLPIEVQMYLTLPFVFLLTRRATDLPRIVVLYGVVLAAAWTLPLVAGRLLGAAFAPCFMAGVVAYALRQRLAPRVPAMLWLPFLALAVLAYIAIEERLPGTHHVALQAAVCLALAFAIPLFRQSGARAFNRVTHLIARYSYGVYLFHCIALWFGIFWMRPRSFWLGMLLALGLVVVLSVASYHLLEAPAIRWGERLARRFGHGRAVPEAQAPAP